MIRMHWLLKPEYFFLLFLSRPLGWVYIALLTAQILCLLRGVKHSDKDHWIGQYMLSVFLLAIAIGHSAGGEEFHNLTGYYAVMIFGIMLIATIITHISCRSKTIE